MYIYIHIYIYIYVYTHNWSCSLSSAAFLHCTTDLAVVETTGGVPTVA